MAWQANPYAVAPLAAAVVTALLVAYVWRYRGDRLAKVLIVLLVAILAWSLAYAIQLTQPTLAGQLFWQRLGLSIGATIPTIWLVFSIVYVGDERRLTTGVLALLLVDPIAFAALAWTNGAHGLLWSSARLAPGLGLDLDFASGYLVHITYAYLLVLAGIGMMVVLFLRSSAMYRRQAGLLVLGAVVPLSANVAFTLGLSPVPGLDFTTPAFAVTGLVFALALFRFDLLDLTPVARRRVLDEFGSGVIVVDGDGRVVHANETAREILSDVAVGRHVTELLPVDDMDDVDGFGSTIDDGSRRRFYEFSVSTLRDFRSREVGHVIAMRDATTDREYEQRLEVINRLLRHNLRNDMNKISGWAEVARDADEEEARSILRQIQAVADDVADMSRKAKRIEATLEARSGDLVAVDAADVAASVVADLRERWPDADVELTAPETAPVRAPTPELLGVALRNVVENAIEHADRSPARVDVTVRTEPGPETVEAEPGSGHGWTIVEVADDGPGIPAMERDTLLTGEETALQHGSGLGLWLVNWITETSGGEIDFDENEPRGSVVRIRLRPA